MKGILENDEDLLGVLSWDDNEEEGVVALHPDFMEEHPIAQLDALQDWISCLTSLYNETLESFEKKY